MQHRFHLTRIGALQAEIREQHDHAECSHTVVPAQAGTHIPETVVMGPRLRGDDRLKLTPRGEQRSRGAAKSDGRYRALLPLFRLFGGAFIAALWGGGNSPPVR